jgi:hypothetical protein
MAAWTNRVMPAPGNVDEDFEPAERGDGARDDALAIDLAGDIGLLHPTAAAGETAMTRRIRQPRPMTIAIRRYRRG